jgi:hypothetical protein
MCKDEKLDEKLVNNFNRFVGGTENANPVELNIALRGFVSGVFRQVGLQKLAEVYSEYKEFEYSATTTTTTKLLEAIAEINTMRISNADMLILMPESVLTDLVCLDAVSTRFIDISPKKLYEFNGVRIIEDRSICKVVVKSMISDHHIEVEV